MPNLPTPPTLLSLSPFHSSDSILLSNQLDRLKAWLSDSTPRVIMLNKEYNFLNSAGTAKETGCRPASNTCPGKGGQDAINGANWCAPHPKISVTYDKAAMTALKVGSNKSIVGVGNKGVIKGVGLRLSGGVSNVIIQNIHITQLNPQYIWGGDAITLVGTDRVWIDHNKVSFSHLERESQGSQKCNSSPSLVVK